QLRQLKEQLEQGLTVRNNLDGLVNEAQKIKESLSNQLQNSEASAKTAGEQLQQVIAANQQAAALLATVQQNERTSSEQLSKTTKSSSEASALEERMKEFYGKVDEYKKHIEATGDKASKSVMENDMK